MIEDLVQKTSVLEIVGDMIRVQAMGPALGDLAVEVFHVPGHTSGNVVFLAEGVLLTGDTAMSYKDGTVGPAPERYADDPSLAQTNLLALRDRLEARNEPVESVAFAHSRGLQDPSAFWAMTASD